MTANEARDMDVEYEGRARALDAGVDLPPTKRAYLGWGDTWPPSLRMPDGEYHRSNAERVGPQGSGSEITGIWYRPAPGAPGILVEA